MMPATPIEVQNADPAAYVAEVDARAERIETPCGDGTMVWRAWGAADLPPLALVHGAQGSWAHWVRNIERLSQHRRLFVADLPGHGLSSMPETTDHDGISAALAKGIEAIAGSGVPIDLCGFSFGGVAFAQFALRRPDLVRRLVIVGCGGLDTPLQRPRLSRVGGLRGEERRAALKGNLLGLMLRHDESADELAVHMLLPMAKAARLSVEHLVLPDRLLEVLPQLAVPLDAIWGELDWPHPDPPVQEAVLRRYQPEMIFKVIEGAGHWAMYERPEAFEAALLAILAQPLRQPR